MDAAPGCNCSAQCSPSCCLTSLASGHPIPSPSLCMHLANFCLVILCMHPPFCCCIKSKPNNRICAKLSCIQTSHEVECMLPDISALGFMLLSTHAAIGVACRERGGGGGGKWLLGSRVIKQVHVRSLCPCSKVQHIITRSCVKT